MLEPVAELGSMVHDPPGVGRSRHARVPLTLAAQAEIAVGVLDAGRRPGRRGRRLLGRLVVQRLALDHPHRLRAIDRVVEDGGLAHARRPPQHEHPAEPAGGAVEEPPWVHPARAPG